MNIDEEIKDLIFEIECLKGEFEIIEKFFKKGMDGNKYRELMVQKNEVEKAINEAEVELEIAQFNKSQQEKINTTFTNYYNLIQFDTITRHSLKTIQIVVISLTTVD